MHQSIKSVAALSLALSFFPTSAGAYQAKSDPLIVPHGSLSPTAAGASGNIEFMSDSELSIWIGEIEVNGSNTLWVELVDPYGEVIYDSMVSANETHLLPDGRAIVVRSGETHSLSAKTDSSRLDFEFPDNTTSKVVHDKKRGTSIELIEPIVREPKPETGISLFKVAEFGQNLWAHVTGFFSSAASSVQVAWNWIFEIRQA